MGGVLFLVSFALNVYLQRCDWGFFAEDGTRLCSDCKIPGHANQRMRCSCGGRLEPFGYFDWVAEAEEDPVARAETIS
jgi:hypothetical protein